DRPGGGRRHGGVRVRERWSSHFWLGVRRRFGGRLRRRACWRGGRHPNRGVDWLDPWLSRRLARPAFALASNKLNSHRARGGRTVSDKLKVYSEAEVPAKIR